MDRLFFYFRTASLSLMRERRRAVFAIFTVVVGVAAIIGLQLTADAIERSLTTNVRSLLRGDLAVRKGTVGSAAESSATAFNDQELSQVRALEENGLIDGFTTSGTSSAVVDIGKFKLSVTGRTDTDAVLSTYQPLFLEKDVYPYYGEVSAGGQGLWDLIQSDYDVAVTRNLANRHDINVNDQLKLSDLEDVFTVRGILASDALGRSGDPIMGNVVFRRDTIDRLFPDLKDSVSEIYVLAPGRTDAELAQIDQRLEAISPLVESTTPAELEADNQDAADNLRTVILVFGLVALAIGGIGIANTMQVLVSRRLPEAGVLKAIGLKGRQVMAIFLAEALIIGVVGSVIGAAAGLALSFLTVRVAEGLVFVDMEWRLGMGPILTGLIVGVLVTLAFGLLPTVGAGRVRPMAAIRPNDSDLVKGSWLVSTLLLVALAATMGIMVGVLIGTVQWGLIGTFGAFVGVGLLLLLLVGLVYLLSRLPAFHRLTLQLSFLEWRRRKTRAAALLLAMSIGVLGIGLTLMLATTMMSGLTGAVEDAAGGDVILAVGNPEEKDRAYATIRDAEGVGLFSPGVIYETDLVAVNGQSMDARVRDYEVSEGTALDAQDRENLKSYFSVIAVRTIDDALPKFQFPADGGRMLGAADNGRNTLVLQALAGLPVTDQLNLNIGDVLTFQGHDRVEAAVGRPAEFEIVGITEDDPLGVSVFGFVTTATDPFRAQGVPPTYIGIVRVGDANRDGLVRDLNLQLDSVLVLEVASFLDVFNELLRQFRMFPLVLSGLSLLAAVVIIANAVALSTIERRREIGLLKAVGAKARWLTMQLVVENAFLGLIGGLIGLGLAYLVLLTLTSLLRIDAAVSPLIVVGVLALAVILSSVVTLFSAVPAARERPLEILRGE